MKYQPNQKIIEVYSKRAGKDVKYFEFLKSCLSNDLELENGLVLQFEKPRIKTDFCYGYSLYGCNTESYDNATESVEHAKSSIIHFIDANIHESMIKYYYDKFKKYFDRDLKSGLRTIQSVIEEIDDIPVTAWVRGVYNDIKYCSYHVKDKLRNELYWHYQYNYK